MYTQTVMDHFKKPLLEVNTDKVDTEIPSPATGTLLDILIPEGTTVNAGTLQAWIGEDGEAIPSGGESSPRELSGIAQADVQARSLVPSSLIPGREQGMGFISPVVARIAGEQGVDLTQVPGTGQGGRITKKDILAYIEGRQKDLVPEKATSAIESAAPPAPPPAAAVAPGDILPHTPVRRAIAEHMVHYPFMTVFWQLTRRTFKRWWTQEVLWGTNVEPFFNHFKLWSQESLFHWLFKTYWRRKREIPDLLSQAEYQHLKVIRLGHPKETEAWLANLSE